MLITGVGYCTLHSSCGTYLANKTGHSVPLGRHFFIQVLFGACVSVSGSAHCTAAIRWAKPESPQPPAGLLPGFRGQKEAVLCQSLRVHSQVHLWHPSSPSCHGSRACSEQDAEFLYRQQYWQLRRWQRLVPFEGFNPEKLEALLI